MLIWLYLPHIWLGEVCSYSLPNLWINGSHPTRGRINRVEDFLELNRNTVLYKCHTVLKWIMKSILFTCWFWVFTEIFRWNSNNKKGSKLELTEISELLSRCIIVPIKGFFFPNFHIHHSYLSFEPEFSQSFVLMFIYIKLIHRAFRWHWWTSSIYKK